MLVLVMILLAFIGVGLFIMRYLMMREITNRFRVTKGNSYMKFQTVAMWSMFYTYDLSLLVFLTIIKLIKLLRFNRRISFLSSTLRQCGKELALFGIVWGLVFFSFVQFFYVILMKDMFQFVTFLRSTETCFAMMLGRFDFQAMTSSNPLSPIFFLLFMVVNMFILMNMGLSILNESFTAVKSDISKQENDFEIVDYILDKFKKWTGRIALLKFFWPKYHREHAKVYPLHLVNCNI